MIVEALIGAVINSLVERAVSAVSTTSSASARFRPILDKERAAEALAEHLRFVEKWSSKIAFRDLLRSKKLAESFVDLDCRLGQIAEDRPIAPDETRRVTSLLNTREHAVVLGRPGAGKTTSLQRLALAALERYESGTTFTPIVVRLRELTGDKSVLDRLASIIALHLEVNESSLSDTRSVPFDSALLKAERRDAQRRAVSAYLDSIKAVLFLDGLDECPAQHRPQAERDINELMEYASTYTVVLTCRSADYTFSFSAATYTLLPLTPSEVRSFASRWLGAKRASIFTEQLERSPYYGAEVIPITIAHLCAIYERRGEIPRQPRFVYQKIVRLLLEDWDEQRGVRRASRYSGFDIDRRQEFLRRIAYELTVAGCHGSFTHSQLAQAYLNSFQQFGLPSEESSRVAREIESHSGLILLSSYERYEFAHKSLQEYLTAEYLLRLPEIPQQHFLRLGEELGVATGLSSRAELYIESIVEAVLRFGADSSRARFSQVFLGRIIIEGPDLTNDEWLGWTLIALWDTGPRDLKSRPESAPQSILHNLLTNDATNRCMRAALKNCQWSASSFGLVRISPPSHVHLPQRVGKHLNSRAAGIAVERWVFEAAQTG